MSLMIFKSGKSLIKNNSNNKEIEEEEEREINNSSHPVDKKMFRKMKL